MEVESFVPPGFRFRPTEEELVGYYLTRKIASDQRNDVQVIKDIDLYKIEPWELQDICKFGYEEQDEWYFFSHKGKKYPSGSRTNRATNAGFWKATGRDKAVFSKSKVIGMRKTLVFYEGRAPNGQKTDWIMHEYRLHRSQQVPSLEEGWVVCRAFKKQIPIQNACFTYNTSYYYNKEKPGLQSRQRAMDSIETSTIGYDEDQICGRRHSSEEQLVDWEALDKILAQQLSEPALSSNSNQLVGNIDYGIDDSNQENYHILSSFHNSLY